VSGERFPVFRCDGCGLLFTQDIPEEDAIGRYYGSDDYISHSDTRKGLVNRLYHAVRNITIKGKRKMALGANGGHRGMLLDYGCGTGAFLSSMRDAGWGVVGLEPDARARVNALALHGLRPEPPEALHTLPDGHFDVVTLWHVLEHVHRLQETLQGLKRVLRPGGTMFIAVPNHASFDARHYGPDWAAWDVPRHLYHFSPASMRRLVELNGLTVSDMRPMWFDSFYVSMLSERYKRHSVGSLRALLTGIRSNLSAIGSPGNCSSVIYVLRHAAGQAGSSE
jgi:SAM-dependent methyltransferase